jgi:hypothetical protein
MTTDPNHATTAAGAEHGVPLPAMPNPQLVRYMSVRGAEAAPSPSSLHPAEDGFAGSDFP